MHAEVRAGGDRVVGAVERAEQAHRGEDQRTQRDAQQDRPQPGLEGQPEEHRKAAEHGGGEGIGAAEDHAEQIDRRGVAFVVGNLFDPEGFDACDCVLVIVVIHDVLRES